MEGENDGELEEHGVVDLEKKTNERNERNNEWKEDAEKEREMDRIGRWYGV